MSLLSKDVLRRKFVPQPDGVSEPKQSNSFIEKMLRSIKKTSKASKAPLVSPHQKKKASFLSKAAVATTTVPTPPVAPLPNGECTKKESAKPEAKCPASNGEKTEDFNADPLATLGKLNVNTDVPLTAETVKVDEPPIVSAPPVIESVAASPPPVASPPKESVAPTVPSLPPFDFANACVRSKIVYAFKS